MKAVHFSKHILNRERKCSQEEVLKSIRSTMKNRESCNRRYHKLIYSSIWEHLGNGNENFRETWLYWRDKQHENFHISAQSGLSEWQQRFCARDITVLLRDLIHISPGVICFLPGWKAPSQNGFMFQGKDLSF